MCRGSTSSNVSDERSCSSFSSSINRLDHPFLPTLYTHFETDKFLPIVGPPVNVTNFVSVRLAGRSNYRIWKAQMFCLIKSQVLLHIIDAENPFPEDNMIVQYDELVKGWIFGTMSDHVNNFVGQPIRDSEVSLKPEHFEGLRFDFTKGLNKKFSLSHR
ncbi:hypothetical protein HanIR_Chr05g0215561 [Helianthus annuus]|uniref:uncharacterized protein LOC110940155 isoform X1 n=1 Tax=Helianthus annuus TaxID=4232 RepID=UPI000B8FB155|nr:uncharacterized protein LOC110940155 isoform X1 [Helianthus annuus]XP_035846584.1 uncharacterized protein LOC110940155 isoform X1 [Helianthus annuus]XP_035846585.1 uncharacterized protein LOC110940155 isoform X1 [Helianthus annuus]KAJ0575682.1 hypothetical protein HanIR_Chr05g0215561 [Helianthus annuus]